MHYKAPNNPLQLSATSTIKPRPNDPEFNIDKALDILIDRLRKYDLFKAVEKYNANYRTGDPEGHARKVLQFFEGINSTETKFEYSPPNPWRVPTPKGLQK